MGRFLAQRTDPVVQALDQPERGAWAGALTRPEWAGASEVHHARFSAGAHEACWQVPRSTAEVPPGVCLRGVVQGALAGVPGAMRWWCRGGGK